MTLMIKIKQKSLIKDQLESLQTKRKWSSFDWVSIKKNTKLFQKTKLRMLGNENIKDDDDFNHDYDKDEDNDRKWKWNLLLKI